MMKKYLGIENYDEINSEQMKSLNIDGLIVGDPFCSHRMFRYGDAGMIDFIRAVCEMGKEIVYQTPVYVTDRNLWQITQLIAFLHDKYNVRKFLMQDIGLINWTVKNVADAEIIWGHWGRNRNSLMNHDFIEFLLKLGVSGIETHFPERIAKIPQTGMPVYAVYGDTTYDTLSRDCYNSYLLDRFDGPCKRECLDNSMKLQNGNTCMTVDGCVLGREIQYPEASEFYQLAEHNSNHLMIYAVDYQNAIQQMKVLKLDKDDAKPVEEYKALKVWFTENRWAAMTLIVMGIIVLLCIVFCKRIEIWNCIRTFLEFCDARPQSISVIVTALVALITGGFALYQFFLLKKKGKLRIHNLYNSIESILFSHVEDIKILANEKNPLYTVSAGRVKKLTQKEMDMICELEKLLYEHGKSHKRGDIKEMIEVINEMRMFFHSINTIYDILERKPGKDISTFKEFQEFLSRTEALHKTIREYREDGLKKHIKI